MRKKLQILDCVSGGLQDTVICMMSFLLLWDTGFGLNNDGTSVKCVIF